VVMRACTVRLTLAALAYAAIAAGAQELTLTASVDRSSVRENESFTYVLRAQGQVRGEPDLTPLAADFDILQRSRSTSIQMAGGQTSQVTEWLLQLMPDRPGQFTLPPVDYAGASSNAVNIEVLPALVSDAPADIFLEVEVAPSPAYAQAEVIYTIRLFRGVSTGRSALSAPETTGGEAIIERLGDDREYQVVRNGRSFMALERRYAIFPQSAGQLTILPVTFEAVVIAATGFSSVQRFRSEAFELEVLSPVAPPPQWRDAAWLPARSLELTERWSSTSGAISLTAGVPQTRTLIVEAEGVQETQLPELRVLPVDGVRQYPDQPELGREVTPRGLQARRTERYAVIAQAAGERTLPGVELPWFDVTERRWKAASVPAQPLEILPSPEAPGPAASAAPQPASPAADGGPGTAVWQAVSAALFVAWLATLGLWWQSWRPQRSVITATAAEAPRRGANRRLLRQLRSACEANDAKRAHALLLEWGALRLPGAEPSSLGAMAQRLPSELAKQIEALERSLFGPERQDWHGRELAQALAEIDSVDRSGETSGGELLMPLYR